MNIRCLFGHTYSVVHPDKVFMQTEFGFFYYGCFAICERCGKRIDRPDESKPFMYPEQPTIRSRYNA